MPDSVSLSVAGATVYETSHTIPLAWLALLDNDDLQRASGRSGEDSWRYVCSVGVGVDRLLGVSEILEESSYLWSFFHVLDRLRDELQRHDEDDELVIDITVALDSYVTDEEMAGEPVRLFGALERTARLGDDDAIVSSFRDLLRDVGQVDIEVTGDLRRDMRALALNYTSESDSAAREVLDDTMLGWYVGDNPDI